MDGKTRPSVQPTAPRRPRQPEQPKAAAEASGNVGSSATSSASRIPTISHVDPSGFSTGNGGGALRSIDQQFEVNPSNGTLGLNLPLQVSAGRQNFNPSLILSYNSGSGNGPFGTGWGLSLGNVSSITRKTTSGIPRYDETDVFLFSGVEDLVKDGKPFSYTASLGEYTVQRYRLRVENGDPARIENFSSETDAADVFWRVISSANVTSFYGRTDQSRIKETTASGSDRVFSWLLTEMYDPLGNAMSFTYAEENEDNLRRPDGYFPVCESKRDPAARTRARHLKSIKYGNLAPARDLDTWEIVGVGDGNKWMFEVVLDYGDHDPDKPTASPTRPWAVRKDPFSAYTSGFEIRMYRLCRRILLFHHFPDELLLDDCLVRSFNLDYDENPAGSFISSLKSTGHVWNSETKAYDSESLAPLTFLYAKNPPLEQLRLKSMKPECLQQLLISKPRSQTRWIDLNGEGAPGLLVQLDGAWYYQRNMNAINIATDSEGSDSDSSNGDSVPELGPVQIMDSYPSTGEYTSSYFEDLDGNGLQDLVLCDEQGRTNGYYECHSKDHWDSYRNFPSTLSFDPNERSVHRLDLTGNGRRDVLLSKADRVEWYTSLGKDGFDHGKACQGQDGIEMMLSEDLKSALYLVDASGSGLTDLLKISNGRVSYSPNLGHGRFGAEVVMDNPPLFDSDDQFSFQRLQLLDLDGNGATDLIYLKPEGGAVAYFNQCGNAWSDGMSLDCFPKIDNLSSVFSIDLLGNGTSCLCWVGADGSSTEEIVIFYLDLTGGTKPHLLRRWTNGLGLTIGAQYTPSTKFFLQDELKGTPWKSKLPFPVHTASRLIEKDEIAASVRTTKFCFHDGYFDGTEREFRGFGMVEKWESEEFLITKGEKKLKMPTRYTKAWYHTGAREMGLAPSSLETFGEVRIQSILPSTLRDDQIEDAYRALKGSPLRSEVYGAESSTANAVPYLVSDTSYEIALTSSSSSRSPSTFRVLPREAFSVHFERQRNDARLEHEIVLETNAYGDVTNSVKINYGRQGTSLSTPTALAQRKNHITFTEIGFTNAVDSDEDRDNYHKPMLASTSVSHIDNSLFSKVFDLEELRKNGFEAVGGNACAGQQSRTYYRSQDLSKRLPLNLFEPFSVLDQEFHLAMSKESLKQVFGQKDLVARKISPPDLIYNACGYVDLDGDANAWKPSHEVLWTAGMAPTDKRPETILKRARKAYLSATASRDAFGNVSTVTLDDYNLLPILSVDPAHNTCTARNDYRVMKPKLVTDANRNRSQVVYDAFGEPAALARMGKVDEMIGDSVDGLPSVVSSDLLRSFINKPSVETAAKLINKAGSRKIWCRTRLSLSGQVLPIFCLNLARTEHATDGSQRSDPADILVSITYLTGRGNQSQEMSLASRDGAEMIWRVTDSGVHCSEGNSVLSMKPYYSGSHLWQPYSESDRPFSIHFLDALHRQVGTIHPNHTWSKESFNPWSSVSHDIGDTVLISDPKSDADVGHYFAMLSSHFYLPSWSELRAQSTDKLMQESCSKSALYADNPMTTLFDSRARALEIIEKSTRGSRSTRSEYDVFGNKVAEYDALGRLVERLQFDSLSRVLIRRNMDKGAQLIILDSAGKPVLECNSAAEQRRLVYDKLSRKMQIWVYDGSVDDEILWSKITYGESLDGAEVKNLRGETFEVSDQSGLRRSSCYDFKGNSVTTETYFALEYRTMLDWRHDVQLQSKPYTSTAEFDALDRPKRTRDAVGRSTAGTFDLLGKPKTLCSSAAEKSLQSEFTEHVSKTMYTAEGQPLRVDYGNSSHSAYLYDPQTSELLNRRTWRDDGTVLEDNTMTYDCLGRISSIADAAQQTQFFRNSQSAPVKKYRYDHFGRLTEAIGRETIETGSNLSRSLRQAAASTPLACQSLPFGQSTEICSFVETYDYDDADNILGMQHRSFDASVGGWTRTYLYNEPSLLEPLKKNNRLSQTSIGDSTEQYRYDGSSGQVGCMTFMSGFSCLEWDVNNKLKCSARQRVNNGDPETTWYVYDDNGQRVRKVTDRAAEKGVAPNKLKETLYLSALEIYHTYKEDGLTAVTTNNTSLVGVAASEDASLVVSIEDPVLVAGSSAAAAPLLRYHVNSNTETDDQGQVISYEEYSPFGVSVMLACRSDIEAPRRYRFAAYRRDQETGLYACGARYYAPWIGRWTSPDPLGTIDGHNLYAYVRNDPVNWIDPEGTAKRPGLTNVLSVFEGEGNLIQLAKHVLQVEKTLYKQKSFLEKIKYKLKGNKKDIFAMISIYLIGTGLNIVLPGAGSVAKVGLKGVFKYFRGKEKKKEQDEKMVNFAGAVGSTAVMLERERLFKKIDEIQGLEDLSSKDKADLIQGLKQGVDHMYAMMADMRENKSNFDPDMDEDQIGEIPESIGAILQSIQFEEPGDADIDSDEEAHNDFNTLRLDGAAPRMGDPVDQPVYQSMNQPMYQSMNQYAPQSVASSVVSNRPMMFDM